MVESVKTIRLSKIAKELNIGISTIIDFVTQKGHKIDSSPNSKISVEIHQILLQEFQSEKIVKEESKLIGIDKTAKETITLEKAEASRGVVTADVEQDEVFIKNLPDIDSIDKKEEPVITKPEKKFDIKIVGKIDVDTVKTKTKSEKKVEEEKVEKEIVKKEEPITEKQPEEEIIKAKSEKLVGPKVVGAIELPPKVRRKKPVASSSDTVKTKKKKKRKRIKWDDLRGGESIDVGTEDVKGKELRRGKGARRRGAKIELTGEEIQKQIKETLARLSDTGKSKASKYRRQKRDAVSEQLQKDLEQQEKEKKILKVTEFVSASELSQMMDVPVNDIISCCMTLGFFVSINQRLDAETLTIVAEEFGYEIKFISPEVQEEIKEEEDLEEDLRESPPIVTVMGHVDHGKTSLLDYIRKTNVIAGEAGGITQHIGAYEVIVNNNKKITFLDTPGHEAFTAMRARGATVTDIAIIVIAADDNVMPQTIEAINHAQAAGVPIVFAINKIDKPGANPDKIKEGLSKMDILVEEWGGKYQSQDISAKDGVNIGELLEKVLLEAEMLELKANPDKKAHGTIIESSLDKGRGYVVTVLVKGGTLRIGDIIVAGCYSGRVKALFNERAEKLEEVGPSMPALMLGLNGAPQSGDKFNVLNDEHEAKEIATKKLQLQREQGIRTQRHITLDEIGRRIAIGDFKELNVIVKGDVDGSIEALTDSLMKLSTEQIQVNVIHKSVGQIIESDVLLASASNAIIVGFQVRPSVNARKLAEQEQIDVRLYSVIYEAINEIKDAMEGMLTPDIEEKVICNLEVREIFKISKVGTVAGCMVLNGKIFRNTNVRLVRDGIVAYTGMLESLKRFKEDVKEVGAGYECGLNILNFNDIKVKDIIEGYEEVQIKKKL
ncbi:MAG: translation initiation factor IF-2 [Bacteroidota bacterium]